MEKELFQLASTHGIWTALSVALIFYILKAQEKRDLKQEQREKNYQDIIKSLNSNLSIVKTIGEDVKEIKQNFLKVS